MCSSMNLNLIALGPRRTGGGFFWKLPLVLEEPDLTSKPAFLFGQFQILFRNYVRVSVRRDPLVQRRHSDPQIISYLFSRKSTCQRDPHRILGELVRRFQSHGQSPLLQ